MARPIVPPAVRINRLSSHEPNTGCWLWLGSISHNGYGWFNLGGTVIHAHRASWTVFRGDIPAGLMVLHRCDVRCCVNPDHLFVGTKRDNCADMAIKGRGSKSPSGMPYGVARTNDTRNESYFVRVKRLGIVHYGGCFRDIGSAAAAAADLKRSLYSVEEEK